MRELAAAGDGDGFGGKAEGLARLIAASVRVPPGFAVEATTLPPDAWDPASRGELERRTAALLAAGRVAVRSSALGEDAKDRSFAGMFATVLNVGSLEQAREAAALCIASGAAERVRAYAGAPAPIPVGLVVQVQIGARTAGACFTVDPAGRDGALVVEAVAGTGDALVSGRAEPERWRVYRSGFGGWETRREARGGAAVLSEAEAALIAGGAADLATRFGHALDLEWAIDRSGLWWLQARPVTAAKDPPSWRVRRFFDGVDDGPVTVWANWNVREVMPDPFEPLEWTLWRDEVLPAVAEPLFGVRRSSALFPHVLAVDLVHGRIYWNMNGLMAGPLGRFFTRGALKAIDAKAGEITRRLAASGVLRPRRLPGSSATVFLGIPGATLKSLGVFVGALAPRRVLAEMERCGEAIRARGDVARLSDRALIEELRLLAQPETDPLRRGQQAMALGFFAHAAAERAFRRHPEALRLLTAGIAGNPTTQISLGIDTLVEAARPLAGLFAEPLTTPDLLRRLDAEPAGAAWLERFRGFLDRNGQRCPREFDLGAPRWSEDPTMILDLVRAGLAAPAGENATARLARLARERHAAVQAALAVSAAWRRPLLRFLARLVELYMPLREAPKHYAMHVFQRMRQAALELGARFVARGLLDARGDVFFLEWDEVKGLVGMEGKPVPAEPDRLRKLVTERREDFQRFHVERPPDFLRSDGVPVDDDSEHAPAADGVLHGTAICVGRARGPVRILREPDPRAMSEGDVLVVEFADPGWTPLFPRAAAVVMEVGGVICHAAVVARELGIPAVFGVAGATRLLADGETVAVDGAAGTVTRSAVTPGP